MFRGRGGIAAAAAMLLLAFSAAARAEPGPLDTVPPETTIVAGPDEVTERRTAQFEFESTEPGSTFECSLDATPFAACASPLVLPEVAIGLHRFEVRAADPAGNVDATPAVHEWEVIAPEPPRLHELSNATTSRWAPVLRRAVVRATPDVAGRVIARLATRTPEGTTNIVLTLARLSDDTGRIWVRVRLPVLPNNSTGWVLRGALGGYNTVNTRLLVDRRTLRATLFRHGRAVWRARIGVGKPHWPTPRGEFYVRVRLDSFRDPFYGPLAFGLSARSAVLTDWPGGGFVGIHGTNAPQLLPGRVSHGCIRLRNTDITRLARLMPVGTPVTIR